MQPDVSCEHADVLRMLERIRRRLLLRHALQGTMWAAAVCAAGSLAMFTIVGVLSLKPLIALALPIPFIVCVALGRRRTRRHAARAVEHAWPSCRNVVITAEELLTHPDRAADWIRDRVLADAARQLDSAPADAVVPLRRHVAGSIACLAATILVIAMLPARAKGLFEPGSSAPGPSDAAGSALSIRVNLQPPAYTGRKGTSIDDPERLDVLERTQARLTFAGSLDGLRVRFGERPIAVRSEAGSAVADIELLESGYFAVERSAGTTLIAVSVIPDRAPSVRVERPARDLILPDAGAVVDIAAAASDDLALEAMSLRYTKVSGSGEQFEFLQGELPIDVTRETSQAWRARGRISLASLGLERGDSLVYRVTARDRRAGAVGVGSSETFFIEVAGPGQVALEGFEMPPEQERHALSQQMILIKIQRLRTRERAMAREQFREESGAIATEQRSVRANFVFLMGGHVEDEEEEAEQEHEIQEGRLENTARREISRAVGHMSSTEQGLLATDMGVALSQAKLAVEAVQRAFGRNRYLLRTIPVRSRIDQSRRLAGALDEARGMDRRVISQPEDQRAAAARRLLMTLLSLAERIKSAGYTAEVATQLTNAAEAALAIDSKDDEWRQFARTLEQLRDTAVIGHQGSPSDEQLRGIIRSLVERVRRESPRTSSVLPAPDRMRSAWAEEQSRR